MFYEDPVIATVDAILRHKWVNEEDLPQILRIDAQQIRKILHRLHHNEKLLHKYCTKCGSNLDCSCRRGKLRVPPHLRDKSENEDGDAEERALQIWYFNYDHVYMVVKCRMLLIRSELLSNYGVDTEGVPRFRCEKCNRTYTDLDIASQRGIFTCTNITCVESKGGPPKLTESEGYRKHVEFMTDRFETQCGRLSALLERLSGATRPNNDPSDVAHETEFRSVLNLKPRSFALISGNTAEILAERKRELAHNGKIEVRFEDDASGNRSQEEEEEEEESDDAGNDRRKQDFSVPWFLQRSSVTREIDHNLMNGKGPSSTAARRGSPAKKRTHEDSDGPYGAGPPEDLRQYAIKYQNVEGGRFRKLLPIYLRRDDNRRWRLGREEFVAPRM